MSNHNISPQSATFPVMISIAELDRMATVVPHIVSVIPTTPPSGTPLAQRIDRGNNATQYIFSSAIFESRHNNARADEIKKELCKERVYAHEHISSYLKYQQISQIKTYVEGIPYIHESVEPYKQSEERIHHNYNMQKMDLLKLPISEQRQIKYDISDAASNDRTDIMNAPVVCPLHQRSFVNINPMLRDAYEKVQEHQKQEAEDYEDHIRLLNIGYEELYQSFKDVYTD